MLAVDGDGRESLGFGKGTRSAGTRRIGEEAGFLNPTYPSVHCSRMGFCEKSNGAMVDTCQAQGRHGGPLYNFLPDQGVTGIFAERLGKRGQSVFRAQEDLLEFFFAAAISSGSECLIPISPMRVR